MNQNNVAIAEAYYTAVGEKNLDDMEKYLHPDVQFISPFAELKSKASVLEAVTRFMTLFNTLTIRAKFDSNDQAVLVYDVDFPAPIGNIPTASLLTFQDKLIAKIELFFDGRPFEKK